MGSTGLDGLVVATGHFRNGILLAPITAAEVVRLVASGRPGAAPDSGSGTASEAGLDQVVFGSCGPERFGGDRAGGGSGAAAGTAVGR